jgi:hypothetical protein
VTAMGNVSAMTHSRRRATGAFFIASFMRAMCASSRCSPPISATNNRRRTVSINLSVGPLIALIAGILILVVPRLLNFIVAIYLIIIGLLGLFGTGALRV